MITFIIVLAFLGFYFLYHTSKRADLTHRYAFQTWLAKHPTKSKMIGSVLLFITLIISIAFEGYGRGIFSYLVVLMTIASLVVIISPLRLFKSYFLIIPIFSFFIEILLV